MTALAHMPLDVAEAYRAGFAEAQRRASVIAGRVGGGPLHELDGPFARGAKLTAETLVNAIGEMQPEGPA